MKFRNAKLRERNKQCVACGIECTSPVDFKTFDYADFCQTKCSKYDLINLSIENIIKPSEFQSFLNTE